MWRGSMAAGRDQNPRQMRSIPYFLLNRQFTAFSRMQWGMVGLAIGTAVAALLALSLYMSNRVSAFSFARSDSETWNFVQIEVEFQNFQLAVFQGLVVTGEGGLLPTDLRDSISSQFDIFFARVDTVTNRLKTYPSDIATKRALQNVINFRNSVAFFIDEGELQTQEELLRIFTASQGAATEVRTFSLSALQSAIGEQEAAREDLERALHRYLTVSLGLIILLILSCLGVIYLWRQIAFRSKIEKKISSYLANLLEISHDAVLVLDESLQIKEFNATAEKIFDCPREEVHGRSVVESFTPKPRREIFETKLKSLLDADTSQTPKIHRAIVHALRMNGERFPAELSIVRDIGLSGKPILIGFVRDISLEWDARERARAALARAKSDADAKSRFLATMSHEMRTPLHGVIAALDMVDDQRDAGCNSDFIGIARDAAATALEQIEDVLEITRQDYTNKRQKPEPFNPKKTIHQICEQLNPLALLRGNRIVFNWTGPEDNVGHERLFSKSVYNLVSNAIKFTECGSITVSGSNQIFDGSATTTVEVSDTGIGITENEGKFIFDDFYSKRAPSKMALSGTGLGLGIVKRSVLAMSGQVNFESVPDKGSVFRISVPARLTEQPNAVNLVRGSTSETSNRHSTLASSETTKNRAFYSSIHINGTSGVSGFHLNKPKKTSVLIIEDHPTNRHLLKAMLEQIGYQVETAHDGLEGISKASSKAYELILTDLNMPNLSGAEAAACIRLLSPSSDACIVAVTAHASMTQDEILELLEQGIDTIVHKPFTKAKLREKLEEALDERESMRAIDQDVSAGTSSGQEENVDFGLDGIDLSALDIRAQEDLKALCEMLDPLPDEDLTNEQCTEIARFAHYVAGSLFLLGRRSLGELLIEIEKYGKTKERRRLKGLYVLLRSEYSRMQDDLGPAEALRNDGRLRSDHHRG